MALKRLSLREQVRDGLLRDIINGAYKQGDRLVEMRIRHPNDDQHPTIFWRRRQTLCQRCFYRPATALEMHDVGCAFKRPRSFCPRQPIVRLHFRRRPQHM